MAAKTAKVTIELPRKLLEAADKICASRGLILDDAVRLYIRSLVTSNERTKALGLLDSMPFGKFEGEAVEVVIMLEPKYISWLLGVSENFKLDPECLELLEITLEKEKDNV